MCDPHALQPSCPTVSPILTSPGPHVLLVWQADLLSKMPQFVHIGTRFSSSKRVALSETGTEYEVHCTKHVYASHLLLQFSLNNTLEDQLLENVSVAVDVSGLAGLELDSEIKCASLPFGTPGDAYLCLPSLRTHLITCLPT